MNIRITNEDGNDVGSFTVCLAISFSLVSWSKGRKPTTNKYVMIPIGNKSTLKL